MNINSFAYKTVVPLKKESLLHGVLKLWGGGKVVVNSLSNGTLVAQSDLTHHAVYVKL